MILYIYIYIIHRHTTHTHIYIYIYYCFGIPHRIIAVEGISPLLPLTWAGKCHRSPIKLTVLAPIARMATFVRKMGLTRLWRFVRFAPPQENPISFCRWITSFFSSHGRKRRHWNLSSCSGSSQWDFPFMPWSHEKSGQKSMKQRNFIIFITFQSR